MPTLWITYSWNDNRDRDVDFMAQELVGVGLTVKLDRWNLSAGNRLWDQIEAFITDPTESDAWMIYATQESLSSPACREELAYALDRALGTRGDEFPVIALFPSRMEPDLIPASIRIRLHVSITDADWRERIAAAVERRAPLIEKSDIPPYTATSHAAPPPFKYVIEVRPRAGVWDPFVAAVPALEHDRVGMTVRSGPRNRVPAVGGVVFSHGEGITPDQQFYYELGGPEATPTHSYYIFLREMPSRLLFGQEGTGGKVFAFENPRIDGAVLS